MVTKLLALLCAIAFASEFYDKKSGVVELTSSNFDSLVKKDNQIYLVEFYAPWCGHCKALTPEWLKAAKDLKGMVKVGAVNCDEEKNKPLASQYGIKGFPTIKVFVGKKAPVDYQGERKAHPIVQYALSMLPSFTKKVTDKNIEEFLASDADVPKALLFSDKKTTEPSTKAQSAKLKGRIVIGEVHSSQKAVVEKYEVTSFPTLLVVAADGNVVRHSGGAVGSSANLFLKEHALPGDDDNDDDGNQPIPQLHDDSCFKAHCADQGGLCAIVFLRSQDRVKQATSEAALLQRVRDSRTDNHFHFGWVDSDVQAEFLSKFGLTAEDYPQLIVLSAKKGRFATYLGAYSEEAVGEFLEGVLRGRIKTFPLSGGVPALTGTKTSKCGKGGRSSSSSGSGSGSSSGGSAAGEKSSKTDSKKDDKKDDKKSGSKSGAAKSVVLTSKNFKDLVLKSKGDWIVEFYAPWCGHCKSLAPEWKKAAQNLKNIVHFGEVDATVETSLAQQYGVQGYPTIKVFRAGNKKKAEDYQGGRTAKDLENYALNMLTAKHVDKVTGAKWSSWLSKKSSLPHVLLLTQKTSIPNLIKSLSVEFADDVLFAVAKDDDEQLKTALKVDSTPALFFIHPESQDDLAFEKYPGDLNWNDISAALKKFQKQNRPKKEEKANCGGGGGDGDAHDDGLCTAPTL